MRKNTTFQSGDRAPGALPPGVQRIDDVLDDLLAQFSARFPEFKILVLSPMDGVGPEGMQPATVPVLM